MKRLDRLDVDEVERLVVSADVSCARASRDGARETKSVSSRTTRM